MFVFFCCLLQRKPNIFYPPVPLVPSVPTVPPVASRCNPVALNFPNPTAAAPLRAIDQPLPLPPPRCRKRNEVPTVTHLIAKVTLGSQPPFDTPSHSSVLFIIIIILIILIFFFLVVVAPTLKFDWLYFMKELVWFGSYSLTVWRAGRRSDTAGCFH